MINLPKGWGVVKPWDRHSLILLAAGLSFAVTGLIYIIDIRTPEQEEALYYATEVMSITAWGYAFIFFGLVAVVSARWPAWPKTLGYTVLTGQSAAWSAFYLLGAIKTSGEPTILSNGLLWALVAFLWWGISGLVSPKEVGEG